MTKASVINIVKNVTKKTVYFERCHLQRRTYRELLANSADPPVSMKHFDIFQVVVLVSAPATLLFWITLATLCSLCFQPQQETVFSEKPQINPLYATCSTSNDKVTDQLENIVMHIAVKNQMFFQTLVETKTERIHSLARDTTPNKYLHCSVSAVWVNMQFIMQFATLPPTG